MRMHKPLGSVLLCLALSLVACNKKEDAAAAAAESERTQIELRVEKVGLLSQHQGTVTVAAADPRFVLVGQVTWTGNADLAPLGSHPAYAIHSPVELGLGEKPVAGGLICLGLTRTRVGGRLVWQLSPTVPDLGCRGGSG